MKIFSRIAIVAALAPIAGTAQATQPLEAALQSPVSFDEALAADYVRPVHLLEPTLADDPAATPSTAASSVTSGSYGDCGCDDVCNTCCGPLWTVRAGAVILERERPDRRRIIEDRTGGTAGDGFTDAFDFGWEGGPDVSITRWLASGKGVEVRYFGALEWDAEANWTSASGWALATNPPRMGTGVASIDASYTSRLNSAEINYRGPASDPISFLIGFRWLEVDETLGVDADFGGNMAEAGWEADNQLFGGQIGANAGLWQSRGPLSLDSWFKAGIYGNDAESDFFLNQTVGPDLAFGDHAGQVAFVGDIAINASYPLTDSLSLRSGYQLLWIEGVATASDQVFATNAVTGGGIDTKGGVFYHGAIVSLDMNW